MSFRDIVTELFVGGAWVDITDDVYLREDITISRGRADEDGQAPPSRCSLTLNNRSGKYSPRNPLGPYYGQLGRNTPLRLAIRGPRDRFDRTASGGWGATATGEPWGTVAVGGTIEPTDWTVSGGEAHHTQPATGGYRASYLSTTAYRDVDVAVTVRLPFTDVLGGTLEPANVIVRGRTTNNYYMARVVIAPTEAVTVAIHHTTGGALAAPVTVAGLTHTAGQALRVRIQAEGQTIRAKVWAAAAAEPHGWHVTAHDTRITEAGWVGVRSGVANGNTNTLPIVFSYRDFEVRIPRFAGEVAAWPGRWDVSGHDAYVPIEANGVLRRLSRGQSPVQSTLRRGLITLANPPVAYWPCEDGERAEFFASALGGPPMLWTGTPTLATDTTFDASAPLPKISHAAWGGFVPTYDNAREQAQIRLLVSVPSSGAADGYTLCRVHTSGSVAFWDIVYNAGGSVTLKGYTADRALVFDSGSIAFALDGRPCRMSLELDQNGANIDWQLGTIEPAGTAGIFRRTLSGHTLGLVTSVLIGVDQGIDDVVVGHISVQNEITSLFELDTQLGAYLNERALDRIIRLCAESGVDLSHHGNPADTPAMGPQGVATLHELLQECAAADMGTLHEPRGVAGLAYRTRTSLYNQLPAASLGQPQLAPPFEPIEDDQLTVNDVTVERTKGASYRATRETGRMSVLDPANGGIGRYDSAVTVNVSSDYQLADIAGWQLHQGTNDEARYPTLAVNLANAGVAANTALSRALLDVSVDDRLAVTDAAAVGIYDDISQLVRGYTETLTPFEHKLAFNCSPERPYQVLVLDSDDLGKLDSSSSTLTADITGTTPSLLVTSTAELWTTAPAEMPIPITVGGEEMTVTAITGTTSPQTFTVTRAANGVVKSHAAGTEVHVARPATLAL